MKYDFKPSFDRSVKSLAAVHKDEIKSACLAFIGSLDKQTQLPGGLGLKHLHVDYWEIRMGLKIRVLFRWRHDLIEFILAGDHDAIKQFLRDYR